MNIKDGITAYQQNGDLAIVERIMKDAAETEFLENPTRRYRFVEGNDVSIELAHPHQYISYRIRAIREKAVKHAWYVREPIRWAYDELNRQLSILYIDMGFNIPFEPVDWEKHIYKYDINTELLEWLRKSDEEITQAYAELGSVANYRLYRHVLALIEPTEEAARREESQIRSEVMVDMEAALKHVLHYVDVTRSDQEIVKYVNQSLMTRYYDAQAKRNGLRRFRKGGADRMVHPNFMTPLGTVLGAEIAEETVWQRVGGRQAEFLRKLAEVAEKDMIAGEMTKYGMSKNKCYVMSGERAQEISGLSYNAARARLTRIRKKVFARGTSSVAR
ncbi:hypothetical protein [Paenibacillus sp. ACRRY]|uniref:hypothetical protein n=1 Tax=Paenibacillus sp. ACRRY TaxID=2918208 RepID=UPI001EF406C9|nr:hypothetical protein [Paenibacillus sp. ACRRY]MCG7386842.1 hypothetical protein [Paenibacillus sp. ACRRY]